MVVIRALRRHYLALDLFPPCSELEVILSGPGRLVNKILADFKTEIHPSQFWKPGSPKPRLMCMLSDEDPFLVLKGLSPLKVANEPSQTFLPVCLPACLPACLVCTWGCKLSKQNGAGLAAEGTNKM